MTSAMTVRLLLLSILRTNVVHSPHHAGREENKEGGCNERGSKSAINEIFVKDSAHLL
jgi:hypothetical protein